MRLAPGPRFLGVGGVGHANQLSVANGQPRCGNGEDGFGGEAIVGIVVGWKIVAGVFGFSLRPDLGWAIGIVLVGKDEVEALGGLAVVADFNVEFVAGVRDCGKGDNEFGGGGFKFGGRFVDSDALDGEADGVEGDFGGVVAKDGEGVSDIADDFSLVDIEVKNDLGVLKIVVTGAGIGFVGGHAKG